jgi:hypothetical protein
MSGPESNGSMLLNKIIPDILISGATMWSIYAKLGTCAAASRMPAQNASAAEAPGCKTQMSRLTSTCAAFEALNEDGASVELFVDPTNGEIKGRG